MNVIEEVINIIKEISAGEEIELTDSLQSDVSLDSLGMVTLLLEIEDVFEIVLNESDMDPFNLTTVEDVVKLVERYLSEEE